MTRQRHIWPIGPELPADLGAGGADYWRYHAVPADGVGRGRYYVRLDVKIVRDRLSPIGLGSCLHGGYGDRTLALLEVVDLLGKGGLRSAERIGLVPSVRGAHQLATARRVCRRHSHAKSRYRQGDLDVQEQPHVKEPLCIEKKAIRYSVCTTSAAAQLRRRPGFV